MPKYMNTSRSIMTFGKREKVGDRMRMRRIKVRPGTTFELDDQSAADYAAHIEHCLEVGTLTADGDTPKKQKRVSKQATKDADKRGG